MKKFTTLLMAAFVVAISMAQSSISVLPPTLQLLKKHSVKNTTMQRVKASTVAVYKSVTIVAGGLTTALTTDEKLTVTNLIINGTIDARDFKIMRDSMPVLYNLDISQVNIASYEGIGGTSNDDFSTYPANEIPEYAFFNVEEANNDVLNNSVLTSILLPSSINAIGNSAFALCSKLTSINIPASVVTLSHTVFTGCNATIQVNAANPKFSSLDGVMFDKMKDTLLYCPTSKTGNYSIPEGVDAIYMGAFYSCSGLTAIELPASLNKLDYMTFYNCSGLTSLKTNNYPIDLSNADDVFMGLNTENCILQVPFGLKSAYSTMEVWNTFANIVENPNGFLIESLTKNISATAGSSTTVSVRATVQWSIESDQSWLSASPTSAFGDGNISLIAQANTSEASRTAKITVSSNGYASQVINVTQSGVQQTITVTAGKLSTVISELQFATISNLKLKGTIDARDFKFMRDYMPMLAELDLGEVNIVAYKGQLGTFNYPIDIEYAANVIPLNTFYNIQTQKGNNTLSTIILPTSITSIHRETFRACNSLTGILTIPPLVTKIEDNAFNSCNKLSIVILPATLNFIGYNAFFGLSSQMAFIVHSDNQYYTSVEGVLLNKNQTRLIQFPAQKEGNYSVPTTVVSLAAESFYMCKKLTSISLPAATTSLASDSAVFIGCSSLTDIIVDANNPIYASENGVLMNKTKTRLLLMPEGKQGEYSIPSTVTIIGSRSFVDCLKLTSLKIPSSVSSFESYAFTGNNGLQSVHVNTLPIDFSNIYGVFEGINTYSCKLYVPYGSGELYRNASRWEDFNNIIESPTGFILAKKELILDQKQGSSATVDIKANVSWMVESNQSWLQVSPTNGNGDATLTVTAQANGTTNNRVATVTVSANGFESQLVTITQNGLPKTITLAAGGLYGSLTENERNTITNLKLKGSIDARDFKTMRDSMPVLANIDLSEASIVAYEGGEGTYHTSIIYAANAIPVYAFMDLKTWQGKKTLRTFICPNSTTVMGDLAFYQAPNLSSITLGWMLQSLGTDAMKGCGSLTEIAIHPLNQYFSFVDGVLYNKNQTTLFQNILAKKDAFEIPATVTRIAQNALENCIQVTKITIPASVTAIDNYAFYDCYNLDTLVVKNKTPGNIMLGNYVFQGVDRDNCVLYVPKGTKDLYNAANQWNGFLNIIEVEPNAKSINLTQAGTLKTILTTTELTNVGKLTITGVIDARDFKTMRDLMPELIEIDLSAANIVAYAGDEGTLAGVGNYPANEMPENALREKTGLLSIKMPLSTTSIGASAFYYCYGLTGEFVIPSQVTKIGMYAFYYCSGLTNVVLPASLITIDKYAFYFCSNLTGTVSIPNLVTTIDDYAFMGCNGITAVSIPASVTKIGLRAFNYCAALTAINVDDNNLNYATINGVLLNKAGTSLIQFPEGNSGMSGTYTIPSFVTDIEPYAFYRCGKLYTIVVKKEVTAIKPYAFGYCNLLTNISVDIQSPNYSSVSGVLFNKNKSELLQFPAGKSGNYTIPITVTKIADAAFIRCSKLTSIAIPAATTSIGASAFYFCSGLTSLTVNSKPIPLTGTSVFTGINYNNCVLKVPYGTKLLFAQTSQWNLFVNRQEDTQGFLVESNNINFESSASNINVNISANVSWTTVSDQSWLSVAPASGSGNGVVSISATANQTDVARIGVITVSATGELSQTITVVQAGLPTNLNVTAGNLESLFTTNQLNGIIDLTLTGTLDARDFKTMRDKMPLLSKLNISAVQIVAYSGLEGTVTNTSVSYPDNTIPDNAFCTPLTYIGKKTLTTIVFPTSLVAIGNTTFENCTGLSGILNIPNTVTSIGIYAFYGCKNITGTLNLPTGLSSIGMDAFYQCSGLTGSLVIPSSVTSLGKYAFYGCYKLDGTLTLPSSLTSIGDYTFANCSFTGTVDIPASVSTIGKSAFLACYSLTAVNIPYSVTFIGDFAFEVSGGAITVDANNPNYSSLDGVLFDKQKTKLIQSPTSKSGSVEIPSSVNTIGKWAFEENAIKSVTIPASVTAIEEGAFYACYSLTAIYAKSATPIDISAVNYVFESIDRTTCTLYVPYGSKMLYKQAAKWQDFVNIIEETTGIDNENSVVVKVYPNPVVDVVTIEGADADAKVSVIDLRGSVLIQQSMTGGNTISVGSLPRGQYILRLVNSDNVQNFKILKQ